MKELDRILSLVNVGICNSEKALTKSHTYVTKAYNQGYKDALFEIRRLVREEMTRSQAKQKICKTENLIRNNPSFFWKDVKILQNTIDFLDRQEDEEEGRGGMCGPI